MAESDKLKQITYHSGRRTSKRRVAIPLDILSTFPSNCALPALACRRERKGHILNYLFGAAGLIE
jgi:hypothetical protein